MNYNVMQKRVAVLLDQPLSESRTNDLISAFKIHIISSHQEAQECRVSSPLALYFEKEGVSESCAKQVIGELSDYARSRQFVTSFYPPTTDMLHFTKAECVATVIEAFRAFDPRTADAVQLAANVALNPGSVSQLGSIARTDALKHERQSDLPPNP